MIMPDFSKGWFEIFKDVLGQFRFRLKAPNGETVAVGEAYKNKQSCEQGIVKVKLYGDNAQVEDLTGGI